MWWNLQGRYHPARCEAPTVNMVGLLKRVQPVKDIICPDFWSPGGCRVSIFHVKLRVLFESDTRLVGCLRHPVILRIVESIGRKIRVIFKISPIHVAEFGGCVLEGVMRKTAIFAFAESTPYTGQVDRGQ